MIENGNGEKKWRRWLFNEVSLFTGVIAIAISVVYWVNNPVAELQRELDAQKADHVLMRAEMKVIDAKTNDLRNDLSVKLMELQVQLDRVEARQIEVLKGLAQLQATHK